MTDLVCEAIENLSTYCLFSAKICFFNFSHFAIFDFFASLEEFWFFFFFLFECRVLWVALEEKFWLEFWKGMLRILVKQEVVFLIWLFGMWKPNSSRWFGKSPASIFSHIVLTQVFNFHLKQKKIYLFDEITVNVITEIYCTTVVWLYFLRERDFHIRWNSVSIIVVIKSLFC